MTNYREILRLSSLQYSQRTIESMAHCSRHTVRDVLQAAKEQGISWPLSDDITNAELELETASLPKQAQGIQPISRTRLSVHPPRTGTVGRDPDAAMGRILREVSAGGPKAVQEYSVWRTVPPLGTHYKSDHAHPAQAGRCHAGRLGRRYHSHPGPGYRGTKCRLFVCCRFALQLLHLRGNLRRHENRELVELPCPCIRLLRWRRTAADP